MDSEAFALASSVQLKQLAERFTQVGVDTAQAKLISDSIRPDSSLPFLAAVILLLPTACQAAVAAACNHVVDPAELHIHAKQTADANNQQAILFFNQPAVSPPAPSHTPDYLGGSAATGHAGVVPMSPPVEIQKHDNGCILSLDLAYPEDEAEEVEERPKVGFQTEADDIDPPE
jgi:hypothetical protein